MTRFPLRLPATRCTIEYATTVAKLVSPLQKAFARICIEHGNGMVEKKRRWKRSLSVHPCYCLGGRREIETSGRSADKESREGNVELARDEVRDTTDRTDVFAPEKREPWMTASAARLSSHRNACWMVAVSGN